MKIRPQVSALLAACEAALPAVAQRTTMPVLQCLKLTAEGDALTVQATDRELSLSLRIDGVPTVHPGEVCVNADQLVRLLKKLDDGEMTLSVPEAECEITAGLDLFSLPVENAANFPALKPPAAGGAFVQIDGPAFARMLARSKHAVNKAEGSRFATTGVNVEIAGESATVVSTDTKRLAILTGKATGGGAWSGLVPLKAVGLVEKIAVGPVEIELAAGRFGLLCGGAYLTSQLISGRFPPYRDIMPKKINFDVPVPVEAFQSACQKMRLMVSDTACRVVVALAAGRMDLSIVTAKGKGKTTVSLPNYTGGAVEFWVDPDYVIDTLKAVEADVVTMKIKDATSPILFTDGADFTGLVMPLTA